MAYNQNISVKVCGNPESSGGFGPILLLNNPSFVVEDQFYVGFDKNSFFFTITTYQTQTVYKLVKNNVRSSGAFRAGSLVIAISIPKNYKLEGGYTPYDVLCALKDEFLKKCMTCKDPVRETYEYNAGKIDGHVLDEVVGKFSLTPFDMPNRVMTTNGPVGYIVATEEKIKELFQDVNYPEFDKFREVVVATAVHTTSYVPISNIQIPRPKKYELIVDGQPQGNCCNLNERLKIICRRKSPLYYEDLSFVFSIQDLIDGNVSHEGVVLDTVQERVSVETESWGTPKKKKVFLAVSPKEYEDYFIRNPQKLEVTLFSSNSITSKKVDVSQQRLVITLEGNEIAALKKKGDINVATTELSQYMVKTCQLVEEDELHVTVEPRKLPSRPPAGNLTVNVTFLEDKDLRGISSVDLQAKNCIDHKEVLHPQNVRLERGTHSKSHKGSFIIKAKSIPPFDFYFTCSIKNEVWKTGKIKPNQKSVTVTFVKIHRPFTERYRKPLVCVLVAMMALVLGGLSFVLYNNFSKENEQEIARQEGFTEDNIAPFLQKVDSLLKTNDLRFSTIEIVYSAYVINKNTIDNYCQKDIYDRKICQRLCDYKTVIDFIQTGQVDSIEEIVDEKNCKLNQEHWNVLGQIVANKHSKDIFKDEYEKLSRMGLKFESFCQIAELYGNCVGYEETDSVVASPESKQNLETGQKKKEISNPVQEITSKNGEDKNNTKSKNEHSGPDSFVCYDENCKIGNYYIRFKTKKELEYHNAKYHLVR